jgi:hypothetical protein
MFRIVRLDHQQVGAGFEEEYLSGRLLARLMDGATDLPDTDLIVYSCDTPNLPPLAADAIAAADRPVLVHLSNETLQHNSDYYSRARWVFRSCFDPGCTQPNVTTAPLGYRSGFAAGAKTQAEEKAPREFAWGFAGQKKSNRAIMAEHMERVTPHFTHYTRDWLSADILTVEQMCDVYARSWFAPCPMGNIHPDSFRVMEALENGCIPVITRFYGFDVMKYTFGDHPFVVGRDWADCARIVQQMMRDPAKLNARRQAVEDWYTQFRETLGEDVARIVRDGSTARCEGSQFDHQREGKADPVLKAVFAWHFREKWKALHRMRRITDLVTLRALRTREDAQ